MEKILDKVSGKPKWKKKSDNISFTEDASKTWGFRGNKLKFPKLPLIKIIQHRPLEGKPKSCTIKRDGDQWFASILCEIEIPDPKARTEPCVGIDRGIRNIIADSDHRLVTNPKFFDKQMKQLARAQRTVARRKVGSRNREKAKNKVNRIYRKGRRQRSHFLHVESTRYAKSHGVIVLEKLNIVGMANSKLARHIYNAGWGMFAKFLEYKLKWSGGSLIKVNPAYTSQTCAICNHIDRASRCGDKFKCTKCDHEDHADLNAAVNILNRASRSVQPVEGSSQRAPRRSRKYKNGHKNHSKQTTV
jgi:putative transposase